MKNKYQFKAKATATVLAVLLAVMSGFAQTRVSGTVKDVDNEAIPGASVVLLNTTTGTVTDINGKYNITVPANSSGKLIYSFIGYVSDTIAIGNRTVIDVTLREASLEIEEVVVVGYGTMLKSDITGSVSQVKINETEAASATSFDQLLQGAVAGVSVTSGSGAPGGVVEIVIRGAASFNTSTEPLYVVDGIIMNPSTQDVVNAIRSGGAGYQEKQNPLSTINPKDILTMEILKDASATAIYGSQGANGVVIITTKQGTTAKPRIDYNSTIQISRVAKTIPMLDMYEWAAFRKEMFERYNLGDAQYRIDTDTTRAMDWQKYCLRQPVSQTHRLSVSGKTETTTYLISGSFSTNNGLIIHTGFTVGNLRLNLDRNITKSLKIGTRSTFSYNETNLTQGNENSGNADRSMLRQMVLTRPYLTKTKYSEDSDDDYEEIVEGPIPWFKEYKDQSNERRMVSSLYGEYTFMKGISFKSTFGIDYRRKLRMRSFGMGIYQGKNNGGLAGMSNMQTFSYNWDNILNLNYTFNKIHRLSGMLGFTLKKTATENIGVENSGVQYLDWGTKGMIQGNVTSGEDFSINESSIVSYFTRGTYSYKDKYVLTATIRADASSKFLKENRTGYFPSFAFAWRLNQEPWLVKSPAISNLKLRIGWGQTGNQSLGSYQTISVYDYTGYPESNEQVKGGYRTSRMTNPYLKWETSQQTNVGFDLSLWKNRLNITVDAYLKDARDLLQQIQMHPSFGFQTLWVNRGLIRNKGIELSVDGTIINGKDFTWQASANIYWNRNTIVRTGLPVGIFGTHEWAAFYGNSVGGSGIISEPHNIFIEGEPMGLFYGYKTQGICQDWNYIDAPVLPEMQNKPRPGDVYFVDQNGDGIITFDDRVVIGNPHPKFAGGFNSTLSYKGASLNANFNGVYGRQVVNGNLLTENNLSDNKNVNNNNIRKEAYHKAWRPEAPSNTHPSLQGYTNRQVIQDRHIEDASFLRLSNLTLAYSFKIKKLPAISNINFSITGQNVWCWNKYSGWDPEVNSFTNDALKYGIDWNSYPAYRSLLFGVGVTF